MKGRAAGEYGLVGLGCLALALASTWPLGAHLGRLLALGTEHEATVPFASAWALWWTSHGLASPFAFWDAPIFFPHEGAFALSEPMLLLGALVAPLLWLGAGAAAAHGVALLLALTSNGVAAYATARWLGLGRTAAGTAAGVAVLLPFVHHELGVLALVPQAGVIVSLGACIKMLEAPSPRRGCALGFAFAATFWLCAQMALFLTSVLAVVLGLSLAIAALVRVALNPRPAPALAWRAHALAWAATLGVALALVTPLAWAMHAELAPQAAARGVDSLARGSTTLFAWSLVPWPQLLPLPFTAVYEDSARRALFPGTLKLALALASLAGLRDVRRRLPVLLLWAVALAGFVLSFAVGATGPGALVEAGLRALPGMDRVRSLWRIAALAHVALALLAALGIEQALRLARTRWPAHARVEAAAAILGLLATVEVWPRGQRFVAAPTARDWAPLVAWIKAHVPEREPIAYWPPPAGPDPASFEPTALAMLVQTLHGRPMLGGYASFFPSDFLDAARALDAFPGPEAAAKLRRAGGRFVVAARSELARRGLSVPPEPWRREVALDDLDLDVYALVAPAEATTWTRNIAPLFAQHCGACHGDARRPALVPPALDTYEAARSSAASSLLAVRRRMMPPFGADNTGLCGTWLDAPWLGDGEIAALTAWVEQGTPRGEGAPASAPDAAAPPTGPTRASVDPGVSFAPGLGERAYRCFVVDSPPHAQAAITALGVTSEPPAAVKQAALYQLRDARALARARALDAGDREPGWPCFGVPSPTDARPLASWSRNTPWQRMPAGTGVPLESSWPVVLQLRYDLVASAPGVPVRARLDLETQSGVRAARLVTVSAAPFVLPAGQAQARARGVWKVDRPSLLLGVVPHAATLGRVLDLEGARPDQKRCLGHFGHWNLYDEQLFRAAQPPALAAGEEIALTCEFSSTSRAAETKAGEAPENEQCLAHLLLLDAP